ncbi:uncharacterized protein LOC121970106 isoform X2 [Zingiber officinale]|uniref:uncharacterized protein LOC121970106 isoform X2 n=1 Tax=Zingiber officinale TaxID=94328 RepID=UPI001C4ABC9B|nr:uncharacterized protein LOC121970106 isoform X2 [Zingiber officinale]
MSSQFFHGFRETFLGFGASGAALGGSSNYMDRQIPFVGILSNISSQNLVILQNGTILCFRGQRIWRYHWILTIVNEDKNIIYLLDCMSNRNRDDAWKSMATNGVKMYNASKGIAKVSGFKQLMGNLKQSGSVECGYYVMRYMKEIVECKNPQLEKMFAGTIKNQYYNQSQYDEVRSEWSEFIYSYLGA